MSDAYEGLVCYVDGWHMTVEVSTVNEHDKEAVRATLTAAGLPEATIQQAVANLPDGPVEIHTPGERLYLEDDGTYRFAQEGDESWHDRVHRQFVTARFT